MDTNGPTQAIIALSPIKQAIARIYHNLTKKHGINLVRQTLRYLVASKHGLPSSAIVDLLSCDELVLAGDDVFKWWNPPVRRLPDLLWKRLREDLGAYLSDRGGYDGLVLHQLYHRQFWETAELLFLSTDREREATAQHLSQFFNGDFSSPSLVSFEESVTISNGPQQGERMTITKAEDRLITPQPLSFEGGKLFNKLKLAELPFEQVNSNQFEQLCTSLFNFEFIESKLAARMKSQLMEDYLYAIDACHYHQPASKATEQCAKNLSQFHRFLKRLQHIFETDTRAVLQFALNEPPPSIVSIEAHLQRNRNSVYFGKVNQQHNTSHHNMP